MNQSTTTSVGMEPCGYCGLFHLGTGICPAVKAIEYYQDGTVKRVELGSRATPQWPWPPYSPSQWPMHPFQSFTTD